MTSLFNVNWLHWILFAASLLCAHASHAEEALSLEDRIYELEAQIAVLKSDLESTRTLAEREPANLLNPAISFVGDIVGQVSFGHKDEHAGHEHSHEGAEHKGHHHHRHDRLNGLMVRELELEFSADIAPGTHALASIGLHASANHIDLHIEEVFMHLRALPLLSELGVSMKLGQFRASLGRMSRMHLHNIAQIDYPYALKAFLGDEGFMAPGVSLNRGFNPGASTALNFYLEATFLKRLPMQEKGAEKFPNGIAHVWLHQELADYHYLDLGGSALIGARKKHDQNLFYLFGGDLHYSFLPPGYGEDPMFLFGSEIYAARIKEGWPLGLFTWAQVRLWHSLFAGLRYDLAPKENELLRFEQAGSVYLSHYTTEFLRFRLGYEHYMPKLKSFEGPHTLMLSAIFIGGSHPAEPYFVNR